jgi:O-glycosyl hydrolase
LDDVRLVVPDQANSSNDYLAPILADEALMKSVAVLSLHSYGDPAGVAGRSYQAIQKSNHPEMRVWLTEYGDLGAPDQSFESEWKKQSLLATRRALGAINEGARAALFWDAFDNHHEHDREFTHYGLIRNDDHRYSPKKRYYAAKQLYRFVPAGAQRIEAVTPQAGLMVSAFRDTAGSLIVVGVKEGGPDSVEIVAPAGQRTWEVYLTTRELNCAKAATLRANGSVKLDVPGEAVFTFVGVLDK